MEKYYMVFVDGGNVPQHRHSTFDSAETEAKRLAELTGRKATVLLAIQTVEIQKFNINRIASELDLPF